MKIPKYFIHPVFVIITTIAFAFFVTGCSATRTVTKYDADGKPYDAQETDYMGTLALLILVSIALAGIAVAASGGPASLPDKKESLFAYAKSTDIQSDGIGCTLPSDINNEKWINIIDANDNLISKHLIKINRSQFKERVINLSEFQISNEIDQQALRKLGKNIAKTNTIDSIPKSMKADLSLLPNDSVRINSVTFSDIETDSCGKATELILASDRGLFNLMISSDGESGHVSIVVSQLN